MPRVPVLEGPQVEARGYGGPGPALVQADTQVSQALREFAQGAGQAADSVVGMVASARAKANAVSQANADTDYQQAETKALYGGTVDPTDAPLHPLTEADINSVGAAPERQPGFLETRGEQAHESSADVLNNLEKSRRKIAEQRFVDAGEREKWLTRSRGMYEDTRRKVEGHVAQQFQVAQEASGEARRQSALAAISLNYRDDKAAEETTARAESSLRKLALSPEDADSKVQRFRSDAAEMRINNFLAEKDFTNAERILEQNKDVLGGKTDNLEKSVFAVKQGAQADSIAMSAVEIARDKGGKVDAEYALEQVDSLVKDNVQLRDEARRRTKERIEVADHALKQKTDDVSKKAFGAFNTGGWSGIPDPLKVELNNRNPELYDRLKNEAERKWKAHQAGTAETRREQAAINKEALNDYLALPTAERAKQDLDLFLAGRGVDAVGASALGPHKRAAAEAVQKGEAERTDDFVATAMAAGNGIAQSKTAKDALKASAVQAYSDFVAKEKRPPSKTEALELIADGLISQYKTEPRFLESLRGKGNERGYERLARERKTGKPATPAAAPEKKLAPGLYTDKAGKVWVVDEQGNKRAQ